MVKLEIAASLNDFKNASTFQSGIMSFLVGLKSSSKELAELNEMFIELDTSKDGILSRQEIEKGLDKLVGKMGGNLDYEELLYSMD